VIPTWRGFFLLVLLAGAIVYAAGRTAYPFLAMNEPLPGSALVVEGWAPDYVFAEAAARIREKSFSSIYVTGGPLDQGAPLSQYRTRAELGAAVLMRMGLDARLVQAVPAPNVRKDRTYASALALKRELRQAGALPERLTVMTLGAHARRSRLLFTKAMGTEAKVGVVSVPSEEYDGRRWWASSQGVRDVVSEAIAYTYARFLFVPEEVGK
jgi:hypothetical protein